MPDAKTGLIVSYHFSITTPPLFVFFSLSLEQTPIQVQTLNSQGM